MHISTPKPSTPGERRVGLTPDVVARLTKEGHEVVVERGAGDHAGFDDAAYVDAGATLGNSSDVWSAEVICAVGFPPEAALQHLGSGSVLISLLQPLDLPERLPRLAATGVTSLAFEMVPRTTRAQAMDVLSSQATIAGYQAVLLAAEKTGKLFPMLTTAAGTIPPAKALILGAGVAGLQAIATARRLGARVSGFDVRSAAAEQVESLGAQFVDVGIEKQDSTQTGGYAKEVQQDTQAVILAGLAKPVADSDIVISTAQIPGRPAPLLITQQMVESMKPGSVIVDLAASTGGNCELTQSDREVGHNGVLILGPTDLAARTAGDASRMYARNAQNLLGLLVGEEGMTVNFEDDIIEGSCVTHGGDVVHPRVKELLARGGA